MQLSSNSKRFAYSTLFINIAFMSLGDEFLNNYCLFSDAGKNPFPESCYAEETLMSWSSLNPNLVATEWSTYNQNSNLQYISQSCPISSEMLLIFKGIYLLRILYSFYQYCLGDNGVRHFPCKALSLLPVPVLNTAWLWMYTSLEELLDMGKGRDRPRQAWWFTLHSWHSARKLRQKECEFEASLCYTARVSKEKPVEAFQMAFRKESDKYVNNMSCVQTIDVLKGKDILTVTRTWLNLEDIVPSEARQPQRTNM